MLDEVAKRFTKTRRNQIGSVAKKDGASVASITVLPCPLQVQSGITSSSTGQIKGDDGPFH